MLISTPEQLNQIACYINTAGFFEISVFGEGGLMLSLRKGGFLIVYIPKVVYVTLELATV
jgi:hypothetical protein